MAKQAGLEQLLVEELQDLFDAEKQLVRALPKMAKSATDEELESALREHLEVTRGQVQRIEEIFGSMDMRPRSRPCRGMQGIVAEGQEHLEEERGETILDAAIAGSARRVEHYEIAAYESARTLAQQLGMRDAAQLLQETLQEEMHADRLLAQISKRLAKEGVAQARFAESETAPRRNARAAGNSRAGGARQSGGRKAAGRAASASGSRSRRSGGGAAHPLIDHDEIRRWAEERGATPSCVRGTGRRGDTGMLRLDFPGYSGEGSLQPISWDQWFEKFDQQDLALMVQDTTAGGEKSNFNKLVSRESVEQRPKTRAAR
jgi:ferritin-like metal-binding protein YciE